MRLVNGNFGNWKVIPLKYFRALGTNWLIFKTSNWDAKLSEYLKNLPEFYIDIVKCWGLTGGGQTKNPKTFIEIRKQIIWNNSFIKFQGKCIALET